MGEATKAITRISRHPLAIAWDEWIESEEGHGCADAGTLGLSTGKRQYLENRLNRAFMAGAKAAALIDSEETK